MYHDVLWQQSSVYQLDLGWYVIDEVVQWQLRCQGIRQTLSS